MYRQCPNPQRQDGVEPDGKEGTPVEGARQRGADLDKILPEERFRSMMRVVLGDRRQSVISVSHAQDRDRRTGVLREGHMHH